MNPSVGFERITFTELRRRLLELHPDLDEQTLNDTLEGATNFKEALSAISRDRQCGRVTHRLFAPSAAQARQARDP